jgi:serine protease AprX
MTYKELLPKPAASVPENLSATTSVATLYQNMPNPFSASSTISFDLHRNAMVELSLWNSSGARVTTLASQSMAAGSHSIKLVGTGLPSGPYFYVLTANGETHTGQLVVTR